MLSKVLSKTESAVKNRKCCQQQKVLSTTESAVNNRKCCQQQKVLSEDLKTKVDNTPICKPRMYTNHYIINNSNKIL